MRWLYKRFKYQFEQRQWQFYIFFLGIFLPYTLQAAAWNEKFEKIINFISNDFMKTIGAIVIIGVAVYAMKNLDRLGEIAWKCVTIILATVSVVYAKDIANWLF
ncbi:TrbC/VirB2 family protein [Helicobacter baculiformis]|uniref:TrbC/VirB2 family protein n=1 Tax=Helicobacter baculiformis TaxID=427351 RepID=A0ABV7ZLB4_9HELI|nr:TrbC/VirB2 family protein [Helicobacter baculiformis]